MCQKVQMDDGSALAVPGFAPKLQATQGSQRRNIPTLGKDTDE